MAQILGFGVSTGVSFFLTPLIVNNIGKDVYGFLGLANNFISYITIFTVALSSMVSRFVTLEVHQKNFITANKYFATVAIANTVVTLILLLPVILIIIFLDLVIDIPKDSVVEVKILWLFLLISFLLSLLTNIFTVATFATNRLDLVGINNIVSNILKAILLISLFNFFIPNLWYVGLATLLCTVYLSVINIKLTKSLTPYLKIKLINFDRSILKRILSLGIWNSLNKLNQTLMTGLDLLITNLFLGATDMSLLAIAKTIPIQLQSFVEMTASTFASHLTISYSSRNIYSFVNEVKLSMKITAFLGIVPIAGLIIFGESFFSLWLGNLSKKDVWLIESLSIITLLPLVFNTVINPLFEVNTITTKIKLPVITNLIIGILNIIIVIILLQYTDLGVYAIAGVSATLIILRMILFVPWYAAHILNLKWYTFYKVLLKGIIAFAFLLSIFSIVNEAFVISSWTAFIIICGLSGILGYLINLFLLFNNIERTAFYKIVKGKIKKR
ncbi:hypothetical protein [Priestia flexa]|uniref:hypothetical protein n=1 Tax=Priestia flexa TaxID=86664 RepID=UPI000AD7182F|nr:hypothetical protein [Priestia flexa]